MLRTIAPRPGFRGLREELQTQLLARSPEHLVGMGWAGLRILAHQRARLRELLEYAAAHSPFHARRLTGPDLDTVEPEDRSALPVMTKAP
jgi:hypothetical protein